MEGHYSRVIWPSRSKTPDLYLGVRPRVKARKGRVGGKRMPTQVVSAEKRQIARYVFTTCRSVKFYVPHRRKKLSIFRRETQKRATCAKRGTNLWDGGFFRRRRILRRIDNSQSVTFYKKKKKKKKSTFSFYTG